MAQNDNIQLFEDKRIRTAWDEEKEEWYFSMVFRCGTQCIIQNWFSNRNTIEPSGCM